MTHRAPGRRYVVRELAFTKGSTNRQLEKSPYFSAACRAAENASHQGRMVQVELRGVPLALYMDGKRVTEA